MPQKYPDTKRDPVIDEVHGVKIEDPYRWLEDATSERVREWVDKQNEFSLSVMGDYSGFEQVKERLWNLYKYDYIMVNFFQVTRAKKGPRLFYLFRKAGSNQPVLCYQDGDDGQREVLFDPMSVSEEGLASIDWLVPSKDGSLVAFGVSEGGTEKSILHVMRVDTKELLEERIPQTKWCSLDWLHNDGFYYSRYPLPGTVSDEDLNYYHHVYYHRLGDDYKSDVKVFGEGRPKTEHPGVETNEEGTLLVVGSHRFISSDLHVARIDPKSPAELTFIPVIETESFDNASRLNGDQLYVMTQDEAPNGRIVRYDLSKFIEGGKIPSRETIIEEGEGVIFGVQYQRFEVFGDKIAVIEDRNASSYLKIFDTAGKLVDDVDFGTHVTLYQVVTGSGLDSLYFGMGSYFSPASHHKYEAGKRKTIFTPDLDIDSSQFKSEQVWYPSRMARRSPCSC